ncbi:hypothetical protein CTE07_45960 [Chitinophaga terrae (ex Kim and Jung 2007)]|nr:hypothetical protein CTE07_45960 [Chitinophaga terrae (ex Kim and Jung 2007)]
MLLCTENTYMKNLLLLLISIIFFACHNSAKTGGKDNATTAAGAEVVTTTTYSGTLPCADCEGIATELTLSINSENKENHFRMKETYQGKNLSFPSEGNFAVLQGTPSDPAATVIQLNPDKDRNLQRFFQKVSENELRQLDNEMRAIDSKNNYSLKKVQ